VTELAEKDEEIASMQHAGEEVEPEHLAAVPDSAAEAGTDEGTGTKNADDDVSGNRGEVLDGGDAVDSGVSSQLYRPCALSLNLRANWVRDRMTELSANLLPMVMMSMILQEMTLMAESGRDIAGAGATVVRASGVLWLA
jgi:hypothetical protein